MGVEARQRLLFAGLLAQGGEFAFVVFGAARTAGVLSDDWAGRLTIAVALSMAATPLMLFLLDKLLAWRASSSELPADTIDETGNPVIIAGFGRFGQIVGRLLFANGIRAIVLDHDPEQIDILRKFGYKVFYGDATRLDILRAAGAEKACLLINAIDDVDDSLALTDRVRDNFPGSADHRAGAQRHALRRVTHARRDDRRARDFRVSTARGPKCARGARRRSFSRARDRRRIPAAQSRNARRARRVFPRRSEGALRGAGGPRGAA